MPAEHGAAGQANPSKKAVKKFPKHLVEIYDIETMLGQGAFSTVWRCKHHATGQIRAVKKIDTSELPPREIAHEIALMRLLRHKNVVRCYDVFLEAQYVNIVVDMFAGGDLIDGLNAYRRVNGRVPDLQLSNISRQMVAAIAHVHSLQIVHRDIKGENFLCDRPDIGNLSCRIALADFGTAIRIEPGEVLSAMVGTPAFWAPELYAGEYEFLADVWAVGVTAFILLTGALPFEGEAQICAPAVPGKRGFPVPYFATPPCVDFIAACLTKDPNSRPTANELAHHAWLATRPQEAPTIPVPDPEAVAKGARQAAGIVAIVLQGFVATCCSCLSCIVDVIIGPGVEASPALLDKHADSSPLPPRILDLQKQVTELERQISISSNISEATAGLRPPRKLSKRSSAWKHEVFEENSPTNAASTS